jgi:hypothetical protein
MIHYFVVFVILFFSVRSLFAAETRYECPPEIQTTQSGKNAPEGWTAVSQNDSHHWINSVGVFDGPPQEMASLVPDDEENLDPAKTVWTFSKKKERPIWFSCGYARTDVLLAKELPLDITQCRLMVSKKKPVNYLGLVCK